MTDIKANIRDFIVENFLFGDTSQPIEDTTSLIDNGYVDSTGVLELVFHIEQSFGIKVADSEIIPANLDSVGAIAAYIEKKQQSAAA
ncbi:MAG: acyl carrier protein [Devosia sp.]|jgi:acyl carrier protein|uniref:acyl carrier protein n=1 Tax=unclassified Devosia TaxID=196773 RepID=UPI001A0E89F8|nr:MULTISPECIES: acyl carrier protein [unclassified Devosia]MBF0679019.1 acyl carrier protein [Devosia sp.]WEJ33633.1 acyl carrier protein [Devosia sp. SD17-2]